MTKYCYLLTSYHFDMCKVWMLIPGKSHFRVNSRNSWVSIETLDFARVSCVIGVGSPRCEGGRSPARPGAVPGRWWDPIAACGWSTLRVVLRPKRPGEGTGGARPGKRNGHQSRGITAPPPPCRTSLDNRLTSRAGWAHEMALVPGVGCQAVNNRLHSLATDLAISLSR